MKRIAIVGAGAIGGLLAARLEAAGGGVTVVARGANLAALQRDGITLIEPQARRLVPLRAVPSLAECGDIDAILLTVKAHQVAPIAAELGAASARGAVVVTMQNGIPWWYFHRHGGALSDTQLHTVDPGGAIRRSIDPAQVIGSVVYPAAELAAPGVVVWIEGNRFSLAELDGRATERLAALCTRLTDAGFKAPASADLRAELWLKLWGNLSFNPISALTHATLAGICRHTHGRDLAAAMMREAQAVAEQLGVRFRISVDKRIAGAAAVGEHKTSMLQDVEHGRALELDALLGSVAELGRLTNTPTPSIDAIYACTALLATTLAEHGGALRITAPAAI